MSSPHVIDVNEDDFQQKVLEESLERPIVVDFWATWCGPCKTLGPLLEALADEYGGAFLLAKVDVDRNPQLASAARVQSIPSVLAVHDGNFIDQFVGALPRPDVKRWIDAVLTRTGTTLPASEPTVPSDSVEAVGYWKTQLEHEPESSEAMLALGRLYLATQRLDEARALLEQIDSSQSQFGDAQASLKVMGLLAEVAEAGGESAVRARLEGSPDDARAVYLVACADLGRDRFTDALEGFIDLVQSGPADVRADAKRAAGTVLNAAGRDDEAIEALRRRLTRLLF